MDGRRQYPQELAQTRSLNNMVGTEGKRKAKPTKQPANHVRKVPIKTRGNTASSLHKTAGRVECQSELLNSS